MNAFNPNRLKKLQERVKQEGLDAYIVDAPVDLFYLLGVKLSLGRLIVKPDHLALYVDGRYIRACQEALPIKVVQTVGYSLGSSFDKESALRGTIVGFDSAFTTFKAYSNLVQLGALLKPKDSLTKRLRMIKEDQEIEALRRAADLCREGYEFLTRALKEGISEKELAAKLEVYWLQNGGEGVGFPPIIAFGENAALPHHRPSERCLKRGDVVLLDIGVILNNYHSDMTRVLFFGPPKEPLAKVYEIVFCAQQKALSCAKPGIPLQQCDAAAREYIKEEGYGELFSHGLGHGLGLEVHEPPRLSFFGEDSIGILEEGMVVTVEPGIYLPGIGGIRLEDTVVITKEGPVSLTKIPITQTPPNL